MTEPQTDRAPRSSGSSIGKEFTAAPGIAVDEVMKVMLNPSFNDVVKPNDIGVFIAFSVDEVSQIVDIDLEQLKPVEGLSKSRAGKTSGKPTETREATWQARQETETTLASVRTPLIS